MSAKQSPVTAAILAGGYLWEEQVVREKLPDGVRIGPGNGPLHQHVFDVQSALEQLARLRKGEAIYQPTIQVPAEFSTRYDLAPELCAFPPCRPDLIQVIAENGSVKWRVIDIKTSNALKPSHRIQATLYALMLDQAVRSAGVDVTVDLEQAGIWLYGQDRPEWFDLRLGKVVVERFLRRRIPELLTSPLDRVAWHLFYRCEWCDFYGHCREEAERNRSVSLIPFLTVGGREYLRNAPWNSDDGIQTLQDLNRLLESKTADQALDACGSLRGQADRLRHAVQALERNEVVPHGGTSLSLPVNEQVSVVLTLQDDPISGKIYAAAYRRLKGSEVYEKGVEEKVFLADRPDQCDMICAAFLQSLHEEMRVLHRYNEEREWAEQKSLQVYVYDRYELTLFNRLLQDALRDPKLAPIALPMLFHFQDTSLADAEDHPAEEVPFPIIVVTGVIRRLLALPLALSLRLPDVSRALSAPSFAFALNANSLFWFELSNTMKSDVVYQIWNEQRKEAREWVSKELVDRLRATHSVIDGLRDEVKEQLFAWPPKFRFPGSLEFRHPELSRLAFIVRYESFMGAMNTRQARTAPWPERVQQGLSIPLQYRGAERWEVLNPLDMSVVEDAGHFFNFILVPHGDEGERAQMSYNDYRHRKALWAPAGVVRLAAIQYQEIDPAAGQITHLQLELKKNKAQPEFAMGDRAVLHPRFVDFTSDRVMGRLAAIDDDPENDYLDLIRQPRQFATTSAPDEAFLTHAEKAAAETAQFTRSQRNAFDHLLRRRLTLVWGPPGTGKTHFLAKAILALVRAGQLAGKPFPVAVTAFTHAAIENLLAEIGQYLDDFGLSDVLSLRKLKDVRTARGEQLGVLDEHEATAALTNGPLVLGGTVYSFRKTGITGRFPLLIVDEASQMKFGELALAMQPLAPGGRLALAGDDLQLPPILQGQYPEPEDGLPGLADSVFSYLRARDDALNPYTFQLQENWRMNRTLSRFPADTLYGADYQPVNREISEQQLCYRKRPASQGSPEDALCEWFWDPEWPLVVAIMEGMRATVANPVEAELVARLASDLRVRTRDPERNSAYPETKQGDKEFWRRCLFIVSPHHAQIRAIRRALARQRQWQSPAFVDTVDKMQGQQSHAVLVSYGVSDIETALSEAEFIYSLNRLNVSVSRARAKCIVFLSRPLLEPSFEVLQNEKACKGLNHMLALQDFCRKHGEQRSFPLDFLDQAGDAVLHAMRAKVV